jgi:hypothetical protein
MRATLFFAWAVLGGCGGKSTEVSDGDSDTDSDSDSDSDSDADSDSDTDADDPCAPCLDASELAICGCLRRDPGTLYDAADPNIDARGTLAVLLYDRNPDDAAGGRRPDPVDIYLDDGADLSNPDVAVLYSFPTIRHLAPLPAGRYWIQALLDEDSSGLERGLALGDLALAPAREVELVDVPIAMDFRMVFRFRGFEGQVSLDAALRYPGDAIGPGAVLLYDEVPADGVAPIGFGGIMGAAGAPPDLSAGPAPYQAFIFDPFFAGGDVWLTGVLDDDATGFDGGLTDGDLFTAAPVQVAFPADAYRVVQDIVLDTAYVPGA